MMRPGVPGFVALASALLLPCGPSVLAHAQPRATYVVVPAAGAATAFATAESGQLLYLNRSGGSYEPGGNDAVRNKTSILSQPAHIPPWQVSDRDWKVVLDCVREQFAPFAIEVTDRDPGERPHIESVVAGNPAMVGLPGGVGGVSPFAEDCSIIPGAIVFTFAELYGDDHQLVCEVIAQEVAHSFGLDHEYECRSNMSYLRRDPATGAACGKKTFTDLDAACGEFKARPCACGRPSQNAYALLAQRIGLAAGPSAPVLITSPQDGDEVDPGFHIRVKTAEDRVIERMVLLVDGRPVAEDTEAPWEFTADASLGDGSHRVEARAHQGTLAASDAITVVVASDSSSPLGCRTAAGTAGLPAGAPLWLLVLALCGCARGRRGGFLATLRPRAAHRKTAALSAGPGSQPRPGGPDRQGRPH